MVELQALGLVERQQRDGVLGERLDLEVVMTARLDQLPERATSSVQYWSAHVMRAVRPVRGRHRPVERLAAVAA